MSTVLVYGYFRSVHVGHFRLFEFAKSLGSGLVVGIHMSDGNDVEFSEAMIRAIPFVDDAFTYSTLETLLSKVKPDLVVRGFEHKYKLDEDNQLLNSKGIKVLYGSGNYQLSAIEYVTLNHGNIHIRNAFREYAHHYSIKKSDVEAITSELRNARVKIVGDLIIDEYVNCQPLGMSQEDHIVVHSPLSHTKFLGGAAIVAAHCKSLGATVEFITLVGNDDNAKWAIEQLSSLGIEKVLSIDDVRPTVLKQRYTTSKQTLFRLNHFRSKPADVGVELSIVRNVTHNLNSYNALIFSDFSYGCLSENVVSEIMKIAKNHKSLISVADSQSSSQLGALRKFQGIDILSATEFEVRSELRNEVDGVAVLTEKISREMGGAAVILKVGVDGLLYLESKEHNKSYVPQEVPASTVSAVDPSGAGDSLLAVSTLARAVGADLKLATFIGSIAAGIQVSRRGNIPITPEEISRAIKEVYQI